MQTKRKKNFPVTETKQELRLKEKVKNSVNYAFAIGFVIIVFFTFMDLFHFMRIADIKAILKNKSTVVGKIIEEGNMKGNYAIAEYYVNGVRYEVNQNSSSNTIQNGEFYEVIYNKNAPKASFINFGRPVFFQNQNRKIVEGKVIDADFQAVRYSYKVNDKEIKRFQSIKSSNYKEYINKKFTVEYLVDTPKISIIHLIPEPENQPYTELFIEIIYKKIKKVFSL